MRAKAITRGARRPLRIAVVSLFAATTVLAAAADSEVEAMLKCKAMQNDADRLACYDSLSSPSAVVIGQSDSDIAPATAPSAAAPVTVEATAEKPAQTAAVLDDDVGRESLQSKDSEKLMVRGQVIKCHKDIRDKYVFSFSNGQVWRQKGNKRIRWKDCNFEVTIKKDFFGYVMQPEGDAKNVRISRVR